MRILILLIVCSFAGCIGSPRIVSLSAERDVGDVTSPTNDVIGDSSQTVQAECFGNHLVQCSVDRSACELKELCKFGCDANRCLSFACNPNSATCNQNLAGTCKNNGTELASPRDCGAKTCSDGRCCNTPSSVHINGGRMCVRFVDSTIQCWGRNEYGQLGNKQTSINPIPKVDFTAVDTANVIDITLGYRFTCVLLSDGNVHCIGQNRSGELGRGTSTQFETTAAAVVEIDGRGKSIASGHGHTCVILKSGGLKCWGENFQGQLGNNSQKERNVPVDVVGLAGAVKSVHLGADNSCVINTDGAILCWGRNNYGQLGTNNKDLRRVPTLVTSFPGKATTVALGNNHMCAINERGVVYCWGDNRFGQLGNGNSDESKIPVRIDVLGESVVAISTGNASQHTCALTSTGKLACWGENYNGSMGLSEPDNRYVPTLVSIPGPPVGVVGDGFSTCVLTPETLYCFGSNSSNWMGTASNLHRWIPSAVLNLFGCDTAL